MKKTANELQTIMTRAHAMTRDTLRAFPEADYRATFSAALRAAWNEETTAVEAWQKMTDEERVSALQIMTYGIARRSKAECDKRGNYREDHFRWLRGEDDLQAVIDDSYIRVMQYLTVDRYAVKPLGVVLWWSVTNAARKIARNEKKHANAIRFSDIAKDNSKDDRRNEDAYIIANAAPIAEPIAPSPEAAAILRDTLESICRDDVDRQIIRDRAEGYSNREIADRLNVSHTAVNKRLEKLLARYKADSYSDNYAAGLNVAN